MRNTLIAISALALAGCNQTADVELTEDQLAICDAIGDDIAELQKRHSSELGEAILMNRMRAQGQLEDPNLDPTALAQFSLLHYEARLGNMLAVLEGNGCDMPTEPVDGRVYSQAAGQCLQARASGIGDAESACNQDNWSPNDPPAEEAAEAPSEDTDDAAGEGAAEEG